MENILIKMPNYSWMIQKFYFIKIKQVKKLKVIK